MTPISLGIFASANQSAAATSYESIATVTVGSGGASNVEFTSIPGTYTHLQIRLIARESASVTNDYIYSQFNGDTASNYATHQLSGDGSSAGAGAFTSIAQNFLQRITGANASSSIFGTMIIDVLDYANTNKYKTIRQLGGFDANGSGLIYFVSGLWQNTNAITSIKITPGQGNFVQYSHFALYGIKSA